MAKKAPSAFVVKECRAALESLEAFPSDDPLVITMQAYWQARLTGEVLEEIRQMSRAKAIQAAQQMPPPLVVTADGSVAILLQ